MNQQKHLRVPTKEYSLTTDKHVRTDLNGRVSADEKYSLSMIKNSLTINQCLPT